MLCMVLMLLAGCATPYTTCFYAFQGENADRIYTILDDVPRIRSVVRSTELCGEKKECICYNITCWGNMAELKAELRYNFKRNGIKPIRVKETGKYSVEVVFDGGFD